MRRNWTLLMAGAVVAAMTFGPAVRTGAEEAKARKADAKKTDAAKVEARKAAAPMVFSDPSKDTTKAAAGGVRWFWPTHMRNFERRKAGNIDLCFLGDSITQGWPGDMFNSHYGKNAVNFGCGGDKIQNLLMRLEGDDGEIKGTTPKVVVLLIGVNNLGDNTPEEIAYGTDNMVKRIKQECPRTKVLLLGILPGRGGSDDKMKATNKLTAKLDDGKTVRFLDMSPKFLDNGGKGLEGVHSDGVHLTRKGYEIWAETMKPLLTAMMADTPAKQEKPAARQATK